MIVKFTSVLLLPFSLLRTISAETSQVLRPSQDANIFEDYDEGAAGTGRFAVGYRIIGSDPGELKELRALIQFDLSSMPSDAQITKASLLLDTYGRTRAGEVDLQIHRIERAWTSDDSALVGYGGDSTVPGNATAGAVTWMHASYPDATWATPGGDFDAAVLSREDNKEREAHVFESTPALVELVQGWVDGSIPNYGVLVRDPELAVEEEEFRLFFSVETNGRGSELEVEYTSVSQPVAPTPSPTPEGTPPPVGVGTLGECGSDEGLGGNVTTFIATEDAMISGGQGDLAATKGTHVVGSTSDGVRRGLYKFDHTDGSVPGDAEVLCTELDFFTIGDETTVGVDNVISLYRLTEGWRSSGTTAASGNNGVPAAEGDVTWTHRSYPNDQWETEGGSFDATVLSEAVINEAEDDVILKSTDALVSVIEAQLQGKIPNYGFILVGNESPSDGNPAQVVIWPTDMPRSGRVPFLTVRWAPAAPVPEVPVVAPQEDAPPAAPRGDAPPTDPPPAAAPAGDPVETSGDAPEEADANPADSDSSVAAPDSPAAWAGGKTIKLKAVALAMLLFGLAA